MRLGSRLLQCARLVRPGTRAADVGTDHAYLPIWLVQEGRCPFVVATDIHTGPAERAAVSIAEAGLTDRIDVRIGDGLEPVSPGEVDDVVVAGMGGEPIADILRAAPWLRDDRIRLVLQPMSKAELLRRFLLDSGYALFQERAVRDGGRLYTVMAAGYAPNQADEQQEIPGVLYGGLLDPSDPDASDYLFRQRRRLLAEASARRAVDPGRADALEFAARSLERACGPIGRTDHPQ